MMKLLLGMVIEIIVAVSVAGGILALLIPALRSDALGERDRAVIAAVVGVLIVSVAVALFRPGSAIRRYAKR